MSLENGKEPEVGGSPLPLTRKASSFRVLLVSLRVGVLLATAAAALVMGLNKQTKSMAVAVVGTTPIFQTLVAKFYYTPAFLYFVIANAMACAYNLLVLTLRPFVKCTAIGLVVDVADKVVLVVVATGAAAAASMAELGKNGNPHSRWFSICDKFEAFCHRSGAAILVSLLGASFLLVISVLSTVTVHRKLAIHGYTSV
uniref:CASP-like protein n=1 Tax=Anthurium amnicola TaxID=1678845 RepID=A0A1D1YQK9_9ARAE